MVGVPKYLINGTQHPKKIDPSTFLQQLLLLIFVISNNPLLSDILSI